MENSERSSMNDVHNPGEVNPLHPAAPFTASDLPIDDDGRIYHIQVKPGQIAPDILIVGDPGRAEFIGSRFLRDLEFEHEHRGLVTITGTSEITCTGNDHFTGKNHRSDLGYRDAFSRDRCE